MPQATRRVNEYRHLKTMIAKKLRYQREKNLFSSLDTRRDETWSASPRSSPQPFMKSQNLMNGEICVQVADPFCLHLSWGGVPRYYFDREGVNGSSFIQTYSFSQFCFKKVYSLLDIVFHQTLISKTKPVSQNFADS